MSTTTVPVEEHVLDFLLRFSGARPLYPGLGSSYEVLASWELCDRQAWEASSEDGHPYLGGDCQSKPEPVKWIDLR